MTDLQAEAAAFLDRAGWGAARAEHLAGDASARRYTRLHLDGARAILMDADPASGEDVHPFRRIATYLTENGLSAPAILAADPDRGFLLLEDLGDALFARLAEQDPAQERPLYRAAVEALDHLHRCPPASGLVEATPAHLAGMLGPFFDHYLPAQGLKVVDAARHAITGAMQAALEAHAPETGVTMLRDFHAENLIWLPEREGVARVGLLDFQDAMLAHPAYDLVSLLQDARRDVSPGLEDEMIAHYAALSGRDPERLRAACAVLGVQRNLRILGVFTRLAEARGKPQYLALLPRVRGHITRTLDHPALAELAPRLRSLLQEGTNG
ncbi:phosphotransferase [Aquicoccus sp. SCR17]|nr:phosphotransferase [Carideicomes alvinocaridis]